MLVVAVVDDDLPIRKALKRLLRSAGYRAETYASGPEFVQSLAAHMPACLVLDIRMQGMSGFELQSWLVEQAIALPIVFITAVDDASELALAHASGAAALLRKPFGDEEFLAAVQAATGDGAAAAQK